jgi:hypothetical protein
MLETYHVFELFMSPFYVVVVLYAYDASIFKFLIKRCSLVRFEPSAHLMHSKPVVFVGTALGANQPIAIEGARTVRSLWGLLAVKLGGWKAYEKIKASDEARTNPGSEALIPILKEGAPCLILLDEVVAYARNLDGIPYDGFISFFQSLTEAANAVPGVLVVGSLPESGAEVGNQRGREALLSLEKVFGRVQSAWTPAQGITNFRA